MRIFFIPCHSDILSSGFIYCSGKFFGCVIFNLIINYVPPRDFPLRWGEDRELKLLSFPSPFPLFVNLLEVPPVTKKIQPTQNSLKSVADLLGPWVA